MSSDRGQSIGATPLRILPRVIRNATKADVAELVRMGREFVGASPFGALGLSDESRERVIRGLLGQFARVIDLEGEIVGALLGGLGPAWGDEQRMIATEMAWWVAPQFRGSVAAVRLLHQFRDWAQAQGAVGVSLSELVLDGVGSLGALPERLGYRLAERSYFLEI